MAYELKKSEKIFRRKSSHWSDDACARLSIHSASQTQLGQNHTTPLYHTFRQIKTYIYLSENNCLRLVITRNFIIAVPQLDGGVFFATFLAKRQRMWSQKRQKCFKIILSTQTVFRWKETRILQNALLRITRSSHSLSTTYPNLLHSGGFMDKLFKPCEHELSEALLPTETGLLFRSVSYTWPWMSSSLFTMFLLGSLTLYLRRLTTRNLIYPLSLFLIGFHRPFKLEFSEQAWCFFWY